MFNIGAGEMVLILVAALLILGPQRLPELARGIGKFVREFRRQTDEVRNVVEREFYSMDQEFQRPQTPPVRPGTPFANTLPPDALPPVLPPQPGLEADSPAPVGDTLSQPLSAPPAPPLAPQVLELGVDGPRPMEPAALQDTTPSPAVPLEDAASTPSSNPATNSPSLAPLPGTVARNAPKRS